MAKYGRLTQIGTNLAVVVQPNVSNIIFNDLWLATDRPVKKRQEKRDIKYISDNYSDTQ
jgi:hypothetical protein